MHAFQRFISSLISVLLKALNEGRKQKVCGVESEAVSGSLLLSSTMSRGCVYHVGPLFPVELGTQSQTPLQP